MTEGFRSFDPDGVPYRALGNVGRWYGGGTPSKQRDDFWVSGTIPWLSPKDMGRAVVSQTTDYITPQALAGSATKLVPAPSVAIVVRSSILERTLPVGLVSVPMTLNQDMKAVVPAEDVDPRFLFYVIRAHASDLLAWCRKIGGSVASLEMPKLLRYRIPIPPLAAQREIVRVLDSYANREASLEADLLAELEARQRHYRYCRDSLMDLPEDVPRVAMGELGEIYRGRRFVKDDYVEEGLDAIHYGELYTHYGTSTSVAVRHVRADLRSKLRFAKRGDVVIAEVGETVDDVGKATAWLGESDVAIHDGCFGFRHSMNPVFVSYYLQTAAFHADKARYVARAKMKRLSLSGIKQIRLPVPSPDEQARTVGILDKLDALVNELSISLPAELGARRKQYEYYRDRLLTFREVA